MLTRIAKDAASALLSIEYLEKQSSLRLAYAKNLVARRSRAVFLRDMEHHCDFAGYILATVIDRKTEAAVYIQDADDWGLELVVANVAKAEKVFDDLFHNCPAFDSVLVKRLLHYGFVGV